MSPAQARKSSCESGMILGFFSPYPAPEPAWFATLGLRTIRPGSEGAHLGISESATHYIDRSLVIAAETSMAPRPPIGEHYAATVADAYRRFGHDCVKHLPGRFRFLLHDADAEQLVASSSMAPSWPLAYWSDSRTTVVCSNVLPMLRCPDVPRALDEPYLVHLVMGLSAMREGSTALRGIRRLSVGEALIVDSSGARVSRVDRLTPRQVGHDREQFGHMFVEELGKAVAASEKRGRAAISLSGGLDSAALAGAGLRHVDGLAAFSFVAPSLDRNAEIESIDAMDRAWPGLHVTRVDASDAGELPDLGPDLRDDPPVTPLALLPARVLLWSRACETGFQTVLEGEGGDELFSMLPTPLDAIQRGNVLDAARHVLGSSGRRALVVHGLSLPFLPGILRRAWLARRQPIEALLPAFAAWDAGTRPVVREAISEYLESLVHCPFPVRLNEWLSAPIVVGAALSRRHLAAGLGLELEWPMLDRAVLEVVLGLHAAGALHGAPAKPFLQEALAGIVPDKVRLLSKDIGLYRALIPRVLASPRSRQALRDPRVRTRLADLVRFERIDAMLDGLEAGRRLGMATLWQLECVVSFAEWYARASREHGVD
jgi:asparagine synthase (glutamine-hydrolysing)